jgi:hypothetical protein
LFFIPTGGWAVSADVILDFSKIGKRLDKP